MRRGESISEIADPRATGIRFARAGEHELLVVSLNDGRVLGLPLWLYPTLAEASSSQREGYDIVGGGRGITWPALDLDLSVRGMLLGTPDMTTTARKTASRLQLRGYARALALATRLRKAG